MGKPKYIETPGKIAEMFEAYYEEVKGKPRLKTEYVGKDGNEVQTPRERPLLIEGFFNFCHRRYNVSLEHYWYNTDGAYEGYRTIITRVKSIIREDQIEGAMLGDYNSNITARVQGLTEKTDVTTNGQEIGNKIEIEIIRKGKIED